MLKSDTAGVQILELELEEGGLDGVYTTVEGLLNNLHDRLESANPFGSGDAANKQYLKNDGGEFSDPSPNYVRFVAFLENHIGLKLLMGQTLTLVLPLERTSIDL